MKWANLKLFMTNVSVGLPGKVKMARKDGYEGLVTVPSGRMKKICTPLSILKIISPCWAFSTGVIRGELSMFSNSCEIVKRAKLWYSSGRKGEKIHCFLKILITLHTYCLTTSSFLSYWIYGDSAIFQHYSFSRKIPSRTRLDFSVVLISQTFKLSISVIFFTTAAPLPMQQTAFSSTTIFCFKLSSYYFPWSSSNHIAVTPLFTKISKTCSKFSIPNY